MLAGYLPFDDDPANPEGDNINLLYKYIVSTPLTFPEYVTPHARDMLRRILVPDPRKRADLFEVARHSWLSEYAHVVEFITSSTTSPEQIRDQPPRVPEVQEMPMLNRSASVREPAKTSKPVFSAAPGDLARKHGHVDGDTPESHAKVAKDNKRRTVQVEYVAPRSQTTRGEDGQAASSSSKTRARSGSQGPVEVQQTPARKPVAVEKPLPQEPIDTSFTTGATKSSSTRSNMPPPSRPTRDPPRSVSDNAFMQQSSEAVQSRPITGNSLSSATGGRASMGLQTRGSSFRQPIAPTVAGTTAHGRMSQPKAGKVYQMSGQYRDDENALNDARPGSSNVPPKFAKVSGFNGAEPTLEQPFSQRQTSGHKRNSTVGSISDRIFGRRGSLFAGKSEKPTERPAKSEKRYPPVSMQTASAAGPRQSVDSRRSFSFGLNKKRSGSIAGSGDGGSSDNQPKSRRFSLLPASFSLKSIGLGKDNYSYESQPHYEAQQEESEQAGQQVSRQPTSQSRGHASYSAGTERDVFVPDARRNKSSGGPPSSHQNNPRYTQQASMVPPIYAQMTSTNAEGYPSQSQQARLARQQNDTPSTTYQASPPPQLTQSQSSPFTGHGRYPAGFNEHDQTVKRQSTSAGNGSRPQRGVLQKNNRRFEDAYENQGGQNAASSGAARKVMDFFRRRGRERTD